ncbi:MAG: tRNA-dihydrouridine synthase family protein [Patescibacteria group bacterium]|nr:tRNA-dihydrouridine synthase family protein [Patescibacteria group bacterium]
MAGVTTYPFASQCLDFGADLAFAPMVHTDFVLNNLEEALKVVDFKEHSNYVIQLVGSDPEKFEEAIKLLLKHVKPLGFDLNAGCPDKNIVKSGCGGALLENPQKIIEVVRAMKSATSLPVSVKTRAGYNNTEAIFGLVDFLNKERVSLLTIHPRKVTQMYSGEADWGIIERVRKMTDIPLCGSGDVKTWQEARDKVGEYSLAGVMIGRGALGRPWIFREIKEKKDYSPTLGEIKELALDLSRKTNSIWGDRGIIEARKHYAWYFKGITGAKGLRTKLMQASTIEEIKLLLH